jgi:predicted amidohydrolase YtcJ
MIQKITNCYDSHTHFWATGQVAKGLKLNGLTCAEDVKDLILHRNHNRAEWLVGFGWNQNNWKQTDFPDKKILDDVFGTTPVFFSRVDGHASWVNSAAISEFKKMGYDFSQDPRGGKIVRDEDGSCSGILMDQAHINALMLLPEFTSEQHRFFFESSQKIFNREGFTHVRDLSMHSGAWNILKSMEDSENLTVCLEAFVTAESLNDVDRILNEIRLMRKAGSQQMRLHGVKIFIDGSLGSKTAFLSQPYLNTNSHGILIWSEDDIKVLLRQAWRAHEQVAIHCIGDAAVHTAVKAAREVASEGILGRLHLEHVQILKPETLQMMKPLHVTCYMQPCHWLSDHTWLRNTLPETLIAHLFQWEQLRKNKIPFFFGSDSPIEPPSLKLNHQALMQSAAWGVRSLEADWKLYHSHPDSLWCTSWTEIDENDLVKQVFFKGQALL